MAAIVHPPQARSSREGALSLVIPAAMLAALSLAFCLETGIVGAGPAPAPLPMPELVTIAPGTFRHRLDGEYYRKGYAIDAPLVETAMSEPLSIMKYQVTAPDYDACVDEGACHPREPGYRTAAPAGDVVPATGVSFDDAVAYAGWLSKKTGQTFSLPNDTEWAYAAGDAFVDDALGIDPDNPNPALRWLADYNREALRKASRDPAPKALGSYGVNDKGLADIAGNVWEWTTTCQKRVDMGIARAARGVDTTCGIYVVEGRHRSPMSSFVRDPKTGGCSVGAPPDNLGFRLVHRTGFMDRIRGIMRW